MNDTEPIIIVGAGGFGRETADGVKAVNAAAGRPHWRLEGVADDAPTNVNLERQGVRGIPYLGTVDQIIAARERPAYVIGIGSPWVRKTIANKLDLVGFTAAKIVHPSATVGSETRVGEGTVILAGVRITTKITLRRHVHINPNVTDGHDSVLHDFVSLNPGSAVSGDCIVGEGALIGVNAVVLNQLSVGAWSVVGGGARAVRSVRGGSVVIGAPAKEMGVNHS